MGTFSPARGSPVRTATLISAEDEAISVATSIAAIFAPAGTENPSQSVEARMELLGRSGLFGISVPTEYGGIDVSNTVLAEVCARASERSTALGKILSAHFVALEQLRTYGSDGQLGTLFPAVLAGARLGRASPARRDGSEAALPRLLPSGTGWRLSGEIFSTPCTRHADWVLTPAQGEAGKTLLLLLPTRIDGLHYVANSCEPAAGGAAPPEHILIKDVLTDSAALFQAVAGTTRTDVPHSLDLLLEGAMRLGAGRRVLANLLAGDNPDALTIGLVSTRVAAAAAAIEHAGRAIDAAQIGLAEQHRTNAFLAAATAFVTATDAARDASATFERTAPGLATDLPTGEIAADLTATLQQAGALRLAAFRDPPGDG